MVVACAPPTVDECKALEHEHQDERIESPTRIHDHIYLHCQSHEGDDRATDALPEEGDEDTNENSCQDFAQKGQGVTFLCERAVVKGNLR